MKITDLQISQKKFLNYSNSIMTFRCRTHNYVGDNSNDCWDIDEIITDLPNLFEINDHKVAKINVKSLTVNVTVENKRFFWILLSWKVLVQQVVALWRNINLLYDRTNNSQW